VLISLRNRNQQTELERKKHSALFFLTGWLVLAIILALGENDLTIACTEGIYRTW